MILPFAQLSFPELYERELAAPLFRPWAELTIDEVGLAAGDRVLDVACGTGIVARLARERVGDSGRVVGVDLSPAMLEVARKVGAGVDWREGSADQLPLRENERFDVVFCHQGLQFFPDRAAAVRQMRQALSPGGRVGISTWGPDEDLPVLGELRRIAERHAGEISDRRHSFGLPGPLEDLLRDAGFHDVRSRTLSRTIHFEDGAIFVRLNAMALVGMSQGGRDLSAEEKSAMADVITRDSAEMVKAASDESGFAFEISAVVATAAV
jgi:ubiquinone/menaquinone biosynthesis C-methylase UbiE